ncbi:MAG: aspartate 1-decarboxylase [Cyanophyceae cyanobacterium]
MKTFVSAKIHGVHVTAGDVNYNGSVGIGKDLMAAAGLDSYEQVHLINLRNGERWITYAIPAPKGEFILNGGSARLGTVGDRCLVIAYQNSDRPFKAPVVFCDSHNQIQQEEAYEIEPTPTAYKVPQL